VDKIYNALILFSVLLRRL